MRQPYWRGNNLLTKMETPPPDVPASFTSSLGMTMGAGYDIYGSGLVTPPEHPGLIGQLGNYTLSKVIGEGTAAVVFQALPPPESPEVRRLGNLDSTCPVAIKVLRPELAKRSDVRQRFITEAEHLKQLQHAHLIQVLDIQSREKLPYYVMPMMSGGNLAQQLQDRPNFSFTQVLKISTQIASSLKYIHSQGLTHRDVKPTNILLDKSGNAYLADMGLCRDFFVPGQLDGPTGSHLAGTAPYMSPAIIAGQAEDTRCDIYAFGATLYEMITGKPPYAGKTLDAIKTQIKQGPPPAIRPNVSNVSSDISSDMIQLVKDCIAHDLRNRYASMSDVLEDLNRLKSKQRIVGAQARRSSLFRPHTTRWLATFLLLGCVAIIGWQIQASQQKTIAHPQNKSTVTTHAPLRVRSEFSIPGILNWNNARIGDWDGDGQIDLFMQQDQTLAAYTLAGEAIAQHNFAMPDRHQFKLYKLYDHDNDKRHEMWVSWTDKTDTQLTLLNQAFFPIKTLHTEGSIFRYPNGGIDTSRLEYGSVIDLENDGKKEILTHIHTGYSLAPRGIICFDQQTGKQNWFYETAPSSSVQAADLDGDGIMEVIVTSGAPSNGHKLSNGTDDAHSYVFCLDHLGQERWRIMTGDHYSSNIAHPIDLNHDGKLEVIIIASALAEHRQNLPEPEFGHIIAVSHDGQEIARFNAGFQIRKELILNNQPNKPPRIAIFTHTGKFTILDHQLKPIISRQFKLTTGNDFITNKFYAVDLNNNHEPEIILSLQEQIIQGPINVGHHNQPPDVRWMYNNRVVILNTQLQTLAQYTLAETWKKKQHIAIHLVDTDHDDKLELLCLSDRITLLDITPKYFQKKSNNTFTKIFSTESSLHNNANQSSQ